MSISALPSSISPWGHRLRDLWLLAILTLLLAGCAMNKEQPAQAVDKNAFYDGKPTQAFAGLKVGSTVPECLALGDEARARNALDEALFHYVHALEIDANSANAYYRIGQVHNQRGNERLASLALRSALNAAPGHVGALTALGGLQLKQNHYRRARELLEQAVARDRQRFPAQAQINYDAQSPAEAYNGLGVLADLDGDPVQAQKDYRTALAIRPGMADVLNNLGYSYYLQHRWSEAEKTYHAALKAEPGYEQAWRNLGLVYVRQQRYLAALNAFERVMGTAQAHNDIGYICMLDGRYDRAERYFERALTLSPVFYKRAHDNLTQVKRLKEAAAVAASK